MANGNGAPSKTVLIAAAILAIGAMVISNTLVQRLDPKEQERLEKEAAAKAAADAAKKATPAPSSSPAVSASPGAPAAPTTTAAAPTDLASLGSDAILGNKNAKREVEVRWIWTPEVQAQPSLVWDTIQKLAKDAPDIRVHAVNVDAEGAPVSAAGVFLNGNNVSPAKPDGSISVDVPAVLGKQ